MKKFISRQFIFPEVRLGYSRDLADTVAVVTGASKGIGKAIVELLLSQGASVVAASRSLQELQSAFPDSDSARLLLQATDVLSEKDVVRLIQKSVAKFGKIDVLINNAGMNIESPLERLSLRDFNAVTGTNVTGAFLTSREVLPYMKSAKSGTIINIGSKISHNTNVGPNKVAYTTSKSALESFSFSLNKELKGTGVRVVCLMPGTVNTFVSLNARKFMSPYQVAEVVLMTIKLQDIDFEGIVFKSINQNI